MANGSNQVMLNLIEYGSMTKQEVKNRLMGIEYKELDRDERDLYGLMINDLTVDQIKAVLQSNYERMVTPPISSLWDQDDEEKY